MNSEYDSFAVMVERQTRHLEGVVPSGVRVQIPLTA
jgi:hypothetical protein